MAESYNYSYAGNYAATGAAYPPRQNPPPPAHHLTGPGMSSYISNPLPPTAYPNYRPPYPPAPTSISHSYSQPISNPIHSQPQSHPGYY